MSGARFKGITSIDSMLGWQNNSFNEFLKLDSSGISEYTMEQIKARSAVLGLTDELTTQAVALAKDADFTAKASTGKLTYRDALKNNIGTTEELVDSLKKSGKLSVENIEELELAAQREGDAYKNVASRIITESNDIADSIINVGANVKTSSTSISTYFKGIVASLKPMIPLLATAGALFVAYKGFQLLDDKYTLTFGTAQKHMEESASAYESNYSELQSINSELETTSSRISELKSKGTLTITEEAELSKLERQNQLLEAQQKLKQSSTDASQKQAASDAETSINYKSEQSIKTRMDKNGFDMSVPIDRKQYIREQVSLMEEAQRQINEARDKINSGDKDKKWEKQLESATNNLNEYKQNATKTLSDLNSEAESLYDKSTGQVIKGYEGLANEISSLNNLVNNFDLTGFEKASASIESFFDGSTGKNFLKDELLEIAKSGDITEDSLSRMGLSLEDIGVSGEEGLSALNRYFKDLVGSVDEATDSVEGFNGSLESIVSASESENQDSKWNTVSDLFDKAKELDKNKKWGTDDFQSMARFIAPEGTLLNIKNTDLKAKDYKDLWDTYNANFKKYFDSENPLQSAINAQDKLISSGLGSMDSNGIITWSENFKTSAQAAEVWGISVEAAEIAMRNLESYGAEFDGVTFSKENLDEYKSSLEGIRSIYESMGEGSQKDRLGKLISGWDEEFAKYEQDLSTLSEDQVVKIKFEYDLASIQQKINELQGIAEEGGDTQSWAELNAAKRAYRNKSESRDGNNSSNVDEYKNVSDTITALQQKLKGATNEQKEQIQDQISGLYDLQNAFNDAFADSGVSWDEFIKTDEYNDALDNMMSSSGEAKEIIAELLGIDVEDITIDVKAEDNASDVINKVSQAEIEDKFVKLIGEDDATPYINLWNIMSADPKFAQLSAEDQATLVLQTYNALSIDDKNSLISQTGGEATQGVADAVARSIDSIPTSKQSTITITTIKETITKAASSINSKVSSGIDPNLKQFMSGTVLSPAHASGTAYNVLNTQPISKAFANGKVTLQQDERALVNEEYLNGHSESIVRDGVWRLIPGGTHFENLKKGDIVFSASQTEALLRNGKISGHARTYASGSLLAPAYGNGMLSLGGNYGNSYGKSYSSTTSKKSNTNTTSKVSQASQAATQASEDLFDFVEKLLDRTKETTKKLTDAINDAVSLADKMSKNSSALSQIQKEISVNQQAYNKYIAQANAVGLAESYASQIRNGNLNIENITDEDLKKKIDDYQKWYDKAKNTQDAIRDLQKDEKELALDRLEYIEDYYDSIINLNDAYKDVNDARIEFNDAIGNTAIGKEVQDYLKSSYDKQYDSYNKALTQLSDYQNEFNELVRNGYINEGSEAWYEGQTKIQEFTKQVDESATALIELEDKIREIDYTRLQQIIDGSDRRTDQLKNAQSLAEARDEQIGRDEYQKQIDELSKSINANYELRDKKIQEQNLYDVTSTRYQELAEEISKIDGEIYSSLEDIEDLKNKIFETEFFNYEKEQENLKYFIGEIDDFARLLNEDAFFTKDGAFTDEAYAKIALTADAMSKCKQQISNATEALKKLDEMYQNGLISETEYTDKQRELLDTIRQNSLAVNDYKNELIDLYKEQMRKENEALKENISLRKKALENQKSYWSYADSIKSKTKDVDALKAQIAALDGVSNSTALAQKKRLQAELADTEKELSDTKRDHQFNLMQDGYDQMSEKLDSSLEDLEYSIATSSEKQLEIVQTMLNQMVSSYQDAYNKINSIINETGFQGTDSFNNTVSNTGSFSGASSIANGATQSQSNVKPSDSTSNINSSNTSNSNHGAIESELKKEPNTDNRLCAELKLSKSSVSIQEGSSTSVSASIRPNDAKNKTLSWTPKDPSIVSATADGKITGLKPGNTTIIVSTTDGSNLHQTITVTVTKKPDPPKPKPPTNSSTPQGNGVPDVGDKVTFVSGIYHEDSYGGGRWGNWELGGSVYITKINPGAPYPIHISKGNRLGSSDRGWLRLDQLRGYNRGSKYIDRRQWAFMDDTENGSLDAGSEVIITNRGILKQFESGDTIFNNEQVQRLWEMSKGLDISRFINLNTSNMIGNLPNIVNRNEMNQSSEINMNFDTLLTIEGNVTKDALPGLEKAIDKMIPHISDKLAIYLRGDMRKL